MIPVLCNKLYLVLRATPPPRGVRGGVARKTLWSYQYKAHHGVSPEWFSVLFRLKRIAMEGRPERIADYFVVVGVGEKKITKFKQFEEEVNFPEKSDLLEPVTDIAVLYSKQEQLPKGYRYWISKCTYIY